MLGDIFEEAGYEAKVPSLSSLEEAFSGPGGQGGHRELEKFP
jgi:hypothetical protein